MDLPDELLVQRDCPICRTPGHYGKITDYARASWRVVICPVCDFAFLPQVPDASAFAREFAWDKTHAAEAAYRRRHYPLLERLEKWTRWRLAIFPRVQPADIVNHHARPGPVIDLGCGSGGFSESLGPGFIPYGIEISPALAQIADGAFARRGGSAVQMTAARGLLQFPDGFFSAAILRSYLEHDAEAREVLSRLHPKMKADSLVIIKVPNFGSLNRRIMKRRWCGFRYPDHCNYFTKASMRKLAAICGFEMRIPWYLGLPTDDNFIAILRPKRKAL